MRNQRKTLRAGHAQTADVYHFLFFFFIFCALLSTCFTALWA